MTAGNSITGIAILGSPDSHSLSGQASIGAYDCHSMGGEAFIGAYDCHSVCGEAFIGAFDSHSISGEAQNGAFDSQAVQGGASVAGVSITVPGTGSTAGLQFGCYVKLGSTTIASSLPIIQLGLPSTGYINVGVNTAAQITVGSSIVTGGSWSRSDTFVTTALSAATWYYLTYALGLSGSNVVQRLYVYQNAALFYDEGQASAGTAPGSDVVITSTLGVGVKTSTNTTFNTWVNWPNSAGWEISKVWLRNANSGTAWGGPTGSTALPLPGIDTDISGLSPAPLVFYACRQTVGSAATLADSSGNGYNAAAGGNGLSVLSDGPYG